MGDAGDQLPFHLMFLYFLVADDHRAFFGSLVAFDEARQNLHAHALFHRQPDRAGLQHLGADAREFEHFLIGHIIELARARDDARVGGIDAVDVGVDVAAIGLQRRCNRHGTRVRSAATECRDAAIVHQPLKARDHRDLTARHRGAERAGVDVGDARARVRFFGADRELPAEPAARGGSHRLQGQREQARGDLLACGDDNVIFGGVVARIGLAAEVDEPVGFACHGRDDDRDLVTVRDFARDEFRHGANPLGARHRRAPEFHHDPRHLAPLS